ARHEETAGEVGAHHRVPALARDRLQRRGELAARVVDEEIDAAQVREDFRNRSFYGIFFPYIQRETKCFPSNLGDFIPDRGEFLDFSSDKGNLRAERCQLV